MECPSQQDACTFGCRANGGESQLRSGKVLAKSSLSFPTHLLLDLSASTGRLRTGRYHPLPPPAVPADAAPVAWPHGAPPPSTAPAALSERRPAVAVAVPASPQSVAAVRPARDCRPAQP